MPNETISKNLKKHHLHLFEMHGHKPEGVDWGINPVDHRLRLEKMLAVTELGISKHIRPSILDVGCGYGSLLELIDERGMRLDYHGIDLCDSMIKTGQTKYPYAHWIEGDILKLELPHRYDYVVCNGILTQKLNATIREFDEFTKAIISRMFELCDIGIAFNLMTTHVNFMVPNLFYRNPVEMLAWWMTELTPRVRLDQSFPLFDYTLYLYRETANGLVYGAHRTIKEGETSSTIV